ncbi:MAG TPA: isoleucine--tRNA ligase [Methanothrix sp.]|nr:isoleucine--tRNA ligase [Methanothrix sp.]HQJ79041.1 isoleucine--tRNA ligase [Methanothrix sp.]
MISEVAGQYSAQELENQIRSLWERDDTYHKVRELRVGGKKFFFVDGPPYTTGRIHLGTAWNKVIKDSILRYRSMNCFEVKDRAGWDMHGLPIEVKVEESFGFRSKKDIEAYGVDRFIERCKEFALRQKDDMTAQFKILGAWLDWDDPYMTLKNEYLEAAWWTLKKANEHNLLERGLRVVNWCPRCQTAIADSEVEYWDETDYSIYVKFPVLGEENTFIVIWTTTPWTIPANVAVAVNPSFQYSKVRAWKDGRPEILIMASDLVESVLKTGRYQDYELLGVLSAEQMQQLHYEHPLGDMVPRQKEIVHGVYAADFVAAENTGCVHIAPGHGLEDYELGLDHHLEIFCPVGEDGRYTAEAGEKYQGLYVKEADSLVIADLEEKERLLSQGRLAHRYGHCWRCKTPIIFIATSQWFLRISDLRDKMLDEISRVTWYPEWAGSARFADWINNARDWCISRQRYWGIPLPIWSCPACGHLEVIGTAAELEERAGRKISDLHRPEVDSVLLDCPCGGKMKRSPDVFDVWFDSAVASWATLRFPSHEEDFNEWWPADFITEGHDQTRGWFYSQLGAAMVSFGRAPYKSVLMHGFTLDDQGRKMSKSIGNIVQPEEVVSKFGADILRFYVLGANAPWEDLHFSWESVENTSRMLNIFWNAYRFALPYMVLDGFDAEKADLSRYEKSLRPEDRWILSRINSLIGEVTEEMEAYQLHRIVRSISEFILEDLSRWYIQLVRPRTWIEQDDPDKLAAYATIYEVLVKLSRVMAPFTPFLSESIYQNLVRGLDGAAAPSVHMCDWPVADGARIDRKLEESMSLVREISMAGSNARQKGGRKLRWPVSEIVISPTKEAVDLGDLVGVLKGQTNAKKITVLPPGEKPKMDLELSPVHKKIGPVYKGEAKAVVAALQAADPFDIKRQLDSGCEAALSYGGKEYRINSEMVQIKELPPENLPAAEFSRGLVYVDITLTPELESEGYAREIIRRIQDMRKEMDLKVEDQIRAKVDIESKPILDLALLKKDHIAGEVRASDFHLGLGLDLDGRLVKDWDIEGVCVRIGIDRA